MRLVDPFQTSPSSISAQTAFQHRFDLLLEQIASGGTRVIVVDIQY